MMAPPTSPRIYVPLVVLAGFLVVPQLFSTFYMNMAILFLLSGFMALADDRERRS